MNLTRFFHIPNWVGIHLVLALILLIGGCASKVEEPSIIVGAQRAQSYLPLLSGKKVGLVVNQTSRVNNLHLVDFLLQNQVEVIRIFAPEHGFRGNQDAGAHIDSSIDIKTGIPITSIYGSNKKPAANDLADIDIVIFDIQDVGLRFYTYISSMHYMMEAAAESQIEFMVLDRPNPNGKYIDGPILEPKFKSFVGMHPIPILHGMTVAELAKMIKGERWINQADDLALITIANANYSREMPYSLPIKPSPNLPNDQSIQLYASLCFFEATPVSVGRGTDFPFQVFGNDKVPLGDFMFSPESRPGSAVKPKLMGETLLGQDLRNSSIHGLDLGPLIDAYKKFKAAELAFFLHASFMDKLAGTEQLRLAIEKGDTAEQIKQSWQSGLKQFKKQRKPYLLYP